MTARGPFRLTIDARGERFDVALRFDQGAALPSRYENLTDREVMSLLHCAGGQHIRRFFDTCPRCQRAREAHAQTLRSRKVGR